MKVGVITDCMKMANLEAALYEAKKLGVSGVQIYATTGEFCPESLTAERKAYLKGLLAQLGVEVSALCGDMGGYGFEIAEDNPERIEKTKAIIDLAVEFGTSVVTTHIGVIPSDKNDPKYGVMLSALTECGKYAAGKGVTLAIETGPEKAVVLNGFIEATEGGVGVNLDPANFTMVTGQDAVEAVKILSGKIVHTHLKDGRMLDPNQNPGDVYHAFAIGGVDALNACAGFEELPIGEGDVDWDNYVKALKDSGFDGYLTIEREAGDNPFDDIKSAVDFINKKI